MGFEKNFSVEWHHTYDTLLLLSFDESPDWLLFHTAVQEAHFLARSKAPQIVHLIIKPPPTLPKGNPITQFSIAARKQPKNMGRLIMVVPTMHSWIASFMRRLATILEKLFPYQDKVIFVLSEAEAINIIYPEQSQINT